MRRVIWRILAGVLALAIVAIVGVLAFVHTDYGRETIRGIVETQVAAKMQGGATIGRIEGSPFSKLVVHDIVLRDAAGAQAVRIGTLSTHIRLLDLLDRTVTLDSLIVDDVDVDTTRTPQLVVPSNDPMAWNLDIRNIAVTHAHVSAANTNVDDITIAGSAKVPATGNAREVDLHVTANSREYKTPVDIVAKLRGDDATASVIAQRYGSLVAAGNIADKRVGGFITTREITYRDGTGIIAGTFVATPDTILAYMSGHAEYVGQPGVDFTVGALVRDLTRVSTTITLDGPGHVRITADLARIDDKILLDRAEVIGTYADARGSVEANVVAHGRLKPDPELAASGTVNGRDIRVEDASVKTFVASFDAAGIPGDPHGHVKIGATGLAKGDTKVAKLSLDAATRPDGRVSFDLKSTIADLAAVVTPPRRDAPTIVVDLGHHRVVEPGTSIQWTGDGGHIVATWPSKISVRGLHSSSVRGTVSFTGAVEPGRVTVDARATTLEGVARVVADVAAPADIRDVAAWKASPRAAIRYARVELSKIALGDGLVYGAIEISPLAIQGAMHARNVKAGSTVLDADLDLRATVRDEMSPSVRVVVPGVGGVTATAQLRVPERPFDPASWTTLGASLVKTATVRTDMVTIEPGMLDRFGIESFMRAKVRATIDVAEGLQKIDAKIVVTDLRGTPLAVPVDVDLTASTDGTSTGATIIVSSQGKPVTLAKIDGRVALSFADLRERLMTKQISKIPIAATIDLPKTNAAQLLAMFGRSDIIAGTLDGKLTIGGTVATPTIDGHVVGQGLTTRPGPRGQPIKVLEKIVLDAKLTKLGGTIKLAGTEKTGGKLNVVLEGRTDHLIEATAKISAEKFDLAPLLAFAPGPAGGARGTIDANLTVVGFDPKTAKVSGELHLHDARIPIAPTIGTLRRATIDISIEPTGIKLAATGKLGPGDIKMDGTIGLKGNTLEGANVKLALRKVQPIGAIEPSVDADITAKLVRVGAQWKADVVVDNGDVVVKTTDGEPIKPASNPPDLMIGKAAEKMPDVPVATNSPSAPPAPAKPTLVANVTLHTTRVKSAEVTTSLTGKLVITADADSVGIVGTVTALSGDLDLFDRRYRIEQAEVRFDGTTDPMLAVRITHDFDEVTTVTNLRGRLSKPELALSSDPGTYSQSELLGFLLGGEPGGDPQAGGARDKLTGAGASLIAGRLGNYVKRALPFNLDVIRYEAAGASSSAAITVGSWVTHALFFAYRQHLDARPDENSGEGTLEYWLTRRVEVEGTAGDRGYNTVDILWRKRF